MFKTTNHITLSEEADKRETVICIVYASVVVFGMLALLLHGLAFLSWTEPTNKEIYQRERMRRNIEMLEGRVQGMESYATEILRLRDHVHRYSDGKIR